MTDALDAAKRKAADTYDAAADAFDDEPLGFWDRHGTRTIQLLRLAPGDRVLDVCCGSGASALPAARAVGADGAVLGVDLAERLLAMARAKASAAGLANADFRRADMTALGFPDRHFDAVVCVFGIFFVPDMEAQVAELWRMVKPGGALAITTWGPGIFAPAYETWLAAVKRARPDLSSAFNPWDRITTPEAVAKLLVDGGVRGDGTIEVVPEEGRQPLRSPEDFWTIARGSGLRWTIDRMGEATAAAVKREVLADLAARDVHHVATNVIYAVARKS